VPHQCSRPTFTSGLEEHEIRYVVEKIEAEGPKVRVHWISCVVVVSNGVRNNGINGADPHQRCRSTATAETDPHQRSRARVRGDLRNDNRRKDRIKTSLRSCPQRVCLHPKQREELHQNAEIEKTQNKGRSYTKRRLPQRNREHLHQKRRDQKQK